MKVMAPEVKDQKAIVDTLVEQGLRAQIRTGNLLTGQLYIALDFFPNAKPAKVDWTKEPPEMPTIQGDSLQALQATLRNIAVKIERLPLDQVATDLRQALQSLNRTLQSADSLVKRLDTEIAPAARETLEESRRTLKTAERTLNTDGPLQQDLRGALRELTRAAQSLRVLTDYLERHPEAVLRGKKRE